MSEFDRELEDWLDYFRVSKSKCRCEALAGVTCTWHTADPDWMERR